MHIGGVNLLRSLLVLAWLTEVSACSGGDPMVGPNPYAAPLEDYYREPLKSRIVDLTLRDAEPRTGRMGYDVAGTLSGLWYLDGSDPRGPEFREDIAFHFGYHHLVTHRSSVIDGPAYVSLEAEASRCGPSGSKGARAGRRLRRARDW